MHNSSGRRLHQCGEGDPKPPALLPLPLPLRTPIPPPPPSSSPLPVPLLTVRHLSPCPRWSSWAAAALRDSAFAPALASAAISDAVAASTAAIVLDRSALSALLSLWDPRTHVFRLLGGPATFSLEDALVLAGLPPSGAPLDRALTPEEEDLRIRLVVEKEKIRELHPCARAARRVSCGSELPDRVFALAARLSLGERIALGPAMVANLYADMDKIVASVAAEGSSSRVDVWAPFSLLQVWMWERCKQLCPPPLKAPPFPISSVRALHWSRRKRTSTQEEALWILQDEDCFDWRPYLYNSSKWMEPKWFSQDTFLVSCTGKDKPEWFADYIAVISQTVLTGWYGDDMDSSVSYNPQLVARQFGYDQVAPVSSANDFASMGNELLPLSSNKKNVLEEAAVNQSDGCIAQERNKYIGEGQLAHVVKGTQGDETNVIVLGLRACNYVDQKKEKKRRDNFAEDCSSKKNKTMVRNNFKNSILQEVQKYSSIQEDLNPSCDALSQLDSDDDCIVLEPCDKQCDVVNLDDEEQSPLDPEFHDRQLVLELDEFVRSGLLSQWEESSDEDEGDGGKRATLKISCKDPYAEAAMREYPLFFEFIPQNPHYRGFVKDQVLGDLAYSGLWFLLISLVKDVVNTSCDTDVSDIAYLMKRAKHLEQLGFNVKHLIARLKEPQIRVKWLQDSMKKLEDAREKEQDAKGVKSLSSHLSKLKHNIQKMERHLDENRQASNSSACDKLNEGIDLVTLEKEVEAAEKFCQAMKDEVASMRTNYSDI
ncbi:hypothetical protein PR202_ga03513 [Eleusine coracana subsp. coracana]|uniref:Aminotransferase-like plant mobile domain-containing protein n=1 Tax=Eleusine coracana subsp. coracana TaxID=191504 RepID=A0AAV5BPH0_ELECO|nr:hypothetical protein PR202_ga03513 [Eleusine coracana subsp. coracana]